MQHGEHTIDLSEKVNSISLEYNIYKFSKTNCSKNPTYKDFKEELSSIPPKLDAFDGYYNMKSEFKKGNQ